MIETKIVNYQIESCEDFIWERRIYYYEMNRFLYISRPQCIGTIVGLIISQILIYFQINGSYANWILKNIFVYIFRLLIEIQIN
jgi:hypothetical protein